MRSSKLLALAFLWATTASAQTINDVQLRPGNTQPWGAAINATGSQDVSQYNTSGAVVDSFRWLQGGSASSATFLFSISPTGSVLGAATGGRQGAGTINVQGLYVNGVAVAGGGFTPGGSSGQVQYNNAGSFGGITGATTNGTALTLVAPVLGTPASGTLTNTTGFPVANLAGAGTGVLTALGVNIGSAGAPILFNGAAGTPTSLVGTNITGTAAGLTAGNVTTNANLTGMVTSIGNATTLGSFTSADLRSALTDESGTGLAYFQGGALGTPSSGTATNITGLPISTGVSGLGAGCATFLGTPSSANLRGCLTDETGTGLAYFQGGALGTPSSGTLTSATGLPISTGVSGLGTGVATAAAVNTNANGGFPTTTGVTTWTPTISTDATPGTPTYTTRVGSYEKIGSTVTAWFNIALSGWTGSPTGNVLITGLPFTSGATASDVGGCIMTVASITTTLGYLSGQINPSTTQAIVFAQPAGGGGQSQLTAAQYGTTGLVRGYCTYHT
jgi:hypothetical protein